MTLKIGQTLLRQFRVDAFVASGGMSAVYRVWDLNRNVPLAMKVLHAELAEDPSIFKRFRREARALQKLAHPNIVPFYGLYRAGGSAFLLERFIDGPSLKDILHQAGRRGLTVEQALSYMKAMCSALGFAHAHGVVHCDVKPGNVMVDRGGAIFLTDFGVARHAESTTTTLGFAGTAAYMAPEQCRAEPVSRETDVYALGIVLYEMLTGRRPFQGSEKETESAGATAGERVRYAHLHLTPEDPGLINPNIPAALSQVILRCLSKTPEERYHTTRELIDAACAAAGVDLGAVSDRVRVPARLAAEAGSWASAFPPLAEAIPEEWAPRRAGGLPWGLDRTRVVAAGGAGLVLLALVFMFIGGGPPSETSEKELGREAALAAASATLPSATATMRRTPTKSFTATSRPRSTDTPITGSVWYPVPGCPASRIRVGDWTRVNDDEPDCNRVRAEPVYGSARILDCAKPGRIMQVLEGPVCSNGLLYWHIRTLEGDLEGWTAEGDSHRYYLDPGSSSPP